MFQNSLSLTKNRSECAISTELVQHQKTFETMFANSLKQNPAGGT